MYMFKVGLRYFEEKDSPWIQEENISPATAELIDSEIKRILQVLFLLFCRKIFNYLRVYFSGILPAGTRHYKEAFEGAQTFG